MSWDVLHKQQDQHIPLLIKQTEAADAEQRTLSRYDREVNRLRGSAPTWPSESLWSTTHSAGRGG